jgi:hypothetical protein
MALLKEGEAGFDARFQREKVTDFDSFKRELNRAEFEENDKFRIAGALRDLKKLMEAGDVSVADFIDAGKDAGRALQDEFGRLPAGSHSGTLLSQDFQNKTGFRFNSAGGVELRGDVFDQDLERRFREEIIPENIPEDQRQAFLEQIPEDIGFETDRFKAEREGIRQRFQAQGAEAEAAGLRSTRLQDLAGLLAQQEERLFGQAIPGIAESAQARGLLDTSAFGRELARTRGQLGAATQETLALQGISDRDAEILGNLRAQQIQQGFQTAGLQREFGQQDLAQQFQQQLQLAALTQPQGGGGGKGGSGISGGLSGAGVGAGIGTAFAPGLGTGIGAAIGGGLGFLGGSQ